VHKAAFDNKGLGECITCHNNHEIQKPSDAMLGTTEGSVCISCHKQGDKGFAAAGEMRSQIDGLLGRIHNSSEILDRAERAGMEVSKPKFDLREAIDGVTHARVLIHSSSPAEVDKVVAPATGIAAKAYQAGVDALTELNFRRKGLVVSLFFILFLAVLVYLKLKDIERRQPA
jgi:predicted CXXCH cytochrome family protein